MADQVWVLAYCNNQDETDNGVLGVYATERLARDAGIVAAKQAPNIGDREVKWDEHGVLFYHVYGDGRWYEVRPRYYVTPWDVQGYPNGEPPTPE